MNKFKDPKFSLGRLSWETAANVIETATDIALIVDGDGVILDVAFRQSDFFAKLGGYEKWLGRQWSQTVTVESRPKVVALLHEAASRTAAWRQLNHQTTTGIDAPVLYSAVQLGRANRFVALGRDLRPAAELQQKLIDAQTSMERDYARLRQVEARYRLLFQLSSEPTLIVDASSRKVLEANPGAVSLFGDKPNKIIGRSFPEGFDFESTEPLRAVLADLRSGGREGEVRAHLTNCNQDVRVTATSFRQDASSMILLRIVRAENVPPHLQPAEARLLKLAEFASDAMVATNLDACILTANKAFIEMAQLTREEQARGESLERWFGRPGIDLKVLVANLGQNETIRMFSTIIRGEHGAITDVEVSAVPIQENMTTNFFGFNIRDVGRRLSPARRSERELPRSADQLTELIGRVPLKDIVHETTFAIERLCIEAALNLTGNNRAAAADLLGLSRQSLYVKLRQFGIFDASDESDQ